MEFDARKYKNSSSMKNFFHLNNPNYLYKLDYIKSNNKDIDFFNHKQMIKIIELVQKLKTIIGQAPIPKTCINNKCKKMKRNFKAKNRFLMKTQQYLSQMGPLALKCKHQFNFFEKKYKTENPSTSKLVDLSDNDSNNINDIVPDENNASFIENGNKERKKLASNLYNMKKQQKKKEIISIQNNYITNKHNNCLIFPRPMDQVYKSKGPLCKIINNDLGYKIEAIDIKTKKKISVHSSKMANVTNNAKHVLNILKKIPLKMGSPIESIQGRNSTMRRNLLGKLVKNSMRGTILSHPTIIDTIILPESFRKSFVLYESIKTLSEETLFDKNFNDYIYPLPFDWSLLVKRDPVLTRGSYVSIEKIGFWNGDCIIMPQVCLELMHGDIDGDENSIGIITGVDVKIEQTLTYSPKFSMYIPFNSTRLIFSQSHSMYMYNKIPRKYAKIYKFVSERIKSERIFNDLKRIDDFKTNFNIELDPQYTRVVLNEILLYITMCEGSYSGYKFVEYILNESNKLANGEISCELIDMDTNNLATPTIYMAGDNLGSKSIRAVLDSNSKGNYSSYMNMCKKLQNLDDTIKFTSNDNSEKKSYLSEKNGIKVGISISISFIPFIFFKKK